MQCKCCEKSANCIIKAGETKFIYVCGHCFDVIWEILSTQKQTVSSSESTKE